MKPKRIVVLVLIAMSATLAGTTSGAQTAPTVVLASADVELETAFTTILSVRELPDGRVLVVDPQEKRVQLVDLARGTVAGVGREGSGPQEYLIPRRLYAIRGDSTLLFDSGANRFLLIGPTGKPVGTRPLPQAAAGAITVFRSVDRDGRLFFVMRPEGPAGDGVDDQVVRFDPRLHRLDTIARLALPPGRIEGARTIGGGRLRLMNTRPLAREDVAAYGWDGRVAVVRSTDYHVEWFDVSLGRTSGPTVAYKSLAITAADRKAFVRGLIVPGQITVAPGPGGRAAPLPPRAAKASQMDSLDDSGMEWPAQMPAFIANAATIAEDGRLWVLRTRAFNDSVPTYDVFNGAGGLVLHVTLPARRRVVGFGRGAVYVVRTDNDDLQYLQRYRSP